MAKPRAARGEERYWSKRVRSGPFRRSLGELIVAELRHLGGLRVKDVIDDAAVRRRIARWTVAAVDREAVVDFALAESRRWEKRLRQERRSLPRLLGEDVAGDLREFLDAAIALPPNSEDLAERLMDDEFMRRMLTDLIFSAIDAFYKRVNPFFGAMTTRMLEGQIKGFIGLFLPTLQKQAVAFATSRGNQELTLDFVRAIARYLLEEPLSRYAAMLPAGREQSAALLRKLLRSPGFETRLRRATILAWADLYERIGDRKIADLVEVGKLAPWLTGVAVDTLDSAFARSGIARFVADELQQARVATERVTPKRKGRDES